MLFNSYPFVILVLITFLFYYMLFRHQQVFILIVSSFVFYGYSQPYLLILLFLSGSINAIISYLVYFEKKDNKKRITAITGVFFNLLVLGVFKYNHLLDGWASEHNQIIDYFITLPLPIGISFYTFQGISLVMDIYHPLKKYDLKIDERFKIHYLNTIFFISFFPQLVAGPIVKAHEFFPQICRKYLKNIDIYYIYKTLVLGYFLKIVIADNLKDQTFWIAYPYFEAQSSLTLITMLFGYSMQIFADFAGYSLIAIGVAAIYGYKLPTNFNFPYISTSIAEFWRRWHISLSTWLKEYLYIDFLGGNRKGSFRTYVNLIVVMFLGGLWHGAALSYGIWGLWHGIGLAFERKVLGKKERNENGNIVITTIRILFIFSFVSFGWLLFKLPNIQDAIHYLYSIGENFHFKHNRVIILNILVYSFPVAIYHLIYLLKNKGIFKSIFEYEYILYSVMLVLIFINGGIPGEFVYFQF